MNKTIRFLVGILFSAVITQSAIAQTTIWNVDLRDALYEVGWIQQGNDGTIIASGSKGLIGLNNNTGETLWTLSELKGVDKNSFLTIDGLPFFYIEYVSLANGGKMRGLIINSNTGEILFDTKDDGYSIKNFNFMYAQNCILFEIKKGNDQMLMKFDLKTMKSKWVTTINTAKGLLGKVNAMSSKSFLNHGPIITKDNSTLIVGIKEVITALNFETGDVSWKKENDKEVTTLVYSNLNNSLYVGIRKTSKLTVLEPSSGKDITPGKLKLRGSMIDVIEGKDGNLILVETEGFNLIDAKTNEFIWKKSYKIEFLDEVVPLTDGYIAIGKNEEAGSISMVDNNGKKIWDCGVKGYVYYAAPTSKGVLYISTRKSNILSYENGKEIWDKDVKFKSIPAVTFDSKEQKVILFENGKGYKFDLNTGAIELFAEDIKLENVEKDTPLTAEYIQNGYFITSDQYASLLTPQGSLAYTHYYEPVSTVDLTSLAEFGLSMAGVDIDIKGSMENINALSALAHGAYVTSKDQNDAKSETSVISGMYLGEDAEHMTPVYEITQTRFSNTKETRDYKFMTVKNKEETGTKNYIYMLNKNSGEIVKKIELIDKTPDYVIDNVDKRIFVNEGNHLITAYQL